MLPDVTINYWAVLVSGVVCMVIGSLWYSPLLFAKLWCKSAGVTESDMKGANMGQAYVLMFLGSLVMSWTLAHLIAYAGMGTVTGGAVMGIVIWGGFMLTSSLASPLFERRSWMLYVINNLYHLVQLVAVGAILGSWH